ncbi:spermidine synthase [Bacillus sp. 2205SS5-2]|uniref:spermidine synthase n=1 Tax=Bacillus sp. 2205SS5-2 TaxID=3109031 RepID=UPI003006D453
MSNWTVNNNFIEINKGDHNHFVYSEKVDNYLSFKYYDYLAWAIYKSRAKNILLLGMGGGTVLQLLKKWSFTPPCTAVEIDADLIEFSVDNQWLDYPNLNIVHADATKYIPTEEYDAIVIDLYNDKGLVEEMYKINKLSYLFNKLSENGSIYLHCFEPALRFEAFNIFFSEKIPSISFTLAQDITRMGGFSNIIRYWTSSLLIASKQPTSIDNNYSWEINSEEIKWLDEFLLSKEKNILSLDEQYTIFTEGYSFSELYKVDNFYLGQFIHSCTDEIKDQISSILKLDTLAEKQVDAYLANGSEISQYRINAAFLLSDLFQKKSQSELKVILIHLLDLYKYDKDSSIKQLISYVYAMLGNFKSAIDYLQN